MDCLSTSVTGSEESDDKGQLSYLCTCVCIVSPRGPNDGIQGCRFPYRSKILEMNGLTMSADVTEVEEATRKNGRKTVCHDEALKQKGDVAPCKVRSSMVEIRVESVTCRVP